MFCDSKKKSFCTWIGSAVVLQLCSRVQLFVVLWTIARQASLPMELFRQEYWSGLPFPPPGDLPGPGIKPGSLASSMLAGRFFITSTTWETQSSPIEI